MKKCEICLKEFEPKEGTTRKYCYECSPSITEVNQSSHKVAIRQAYKREVMNLFDNKCYYCGIQGHQAMFDLHHIHEEDKEFSIATEGYVVKWLKILEESKKCVLLCKNCHALYHIGAIQIDFSKQDYSLIDERINFAKQNDYDVEQKKVCTQCGNPINDSDSHLCRECYLKKLQEGRPTALELAKMIVEKGFEAVGRDYGISGNSIKKWCKTYNIPYMKEELKEWYNLQLGLSESKSPQRTTLDMTQTKVSMFKKNELIKEFNSVSDCAKYLIENNISTSFDDSKEGISRVIRGKRNSYLGFQFK